MQSNAVCMTSIESFTLFKDRPLSFVKAFLWICIMLALMTFIVLPLKSYAVTCSGEYVKELSNTELSTSITITNNLDNQISLTLPDGMSTEQDTNLPPGATISVTIKANQKTCEYSREIFGAGSTTKNYSIINKIDSIKYTLLAGLLKGRTETINITADYITGTDQHSKDPNFEYWYQVCTPKGACYINEDIANADILYSFTGDGLKESQMLLMKEIKDDKWGDAYDASKNKASLSINNLPIANYLRIVNHTSNDIKVTTVSGLGLNEASINEVKKNPLYAQDTKELILTEANVTSGSLSLDKGEIIIEKLSNGNYYCSTSKQSVPNMDCILAEAPDELRIQSKENSTLYIGGEWKVSTGGGVGIISLRVTNKGNVVLYDITKGEQVKKSLWDLRVETNNPNLFVNRLSFQSDGNLVAYGKGNNPIWYSNTSGNEGATLVLQRDMNLVIYDNNHHALWSTNTSQAVEYDTYNAIHLFDEPMINFHVCLTGSGDLFSYNADVFDKFILKNQCYQNNTPLSSAAIDNTFDLRIDFDASQPFPVSQTYKARVMDNGGISVVVRDNPLKVDFNISDEFSQNITSIINVYSYPTGPYVLSCQDIYLSDSAILKANCLGKSLSLDMKTEKSCKGDNPIVYLLQKGDGDPYLTCEKSNLITNMFPDTLYSFGITKLNINHQMKSPDHNYTLMFQGDGNFVLFNKDGGIEWASNQYKYNQDDLSYLVMQQDCNLVVYSRDHKPLLQSTTDDGNTTGMGGNCYLRLQNDGNLVLYDGNTGNAIAATNSSGIHGTLGFERL